MLLGGVKPSEVAAHFYPDLPDLIAFISSCYPLSMWDGTIKSTVDWYMQDGLMTLTDIADGSCTPTVECDKLKPKGGVYNGNGNSEVSWM